MNPREPVILLAEDDRNDVFFVRRGIEQAGARVSLRVLPDGKDVIDYLAARGMFADRNQFPLPSLLLLDLKMPLAGGFDVLEWLRTQPALDYLPVIVLTSSPEERDRQKAAKLGATRYFVKPPTQEMVSEMIQLMRSAPTAM
ncbi:MAG TPA: response regulator [Candidatus Polarisedimenticolia bacterium]|nr:response regulator [Candidatus Polarisedimenticolia bacterium]